MVVDYSNINANYTVNRVIDMQETIPISKFKATCLRLLDNVKKNR